MCEGSSPSPRIYCRNRGLVQFTGRGGEAAGRLTVTFTVTSPGIARRRFCWTRGQREGTAGEKETKRGEGEGGRGGRAEPGRGPGAAVPPGRDDRFAYSVATLYAVAVLSLIPNSFPALPVLLARAEPWLAKLDNAPPVKKLRDEGETIAAHLKRVGSSRPNVNRVARFKVMAEYRLGEILRETGPRHGGDRKSRSDRRTLKSIGVEDRRLSARWKRMAEVPRSFFAVAFIFANASRLASGDRFRRT